MQYDKEIALNILRRVLTSIEHIEKRSKPYHCADDYLVNPMGSRFLTLFVCNSLQ